MDAKVNLGLSNASFLAGLQEAEQRSKGFESTVQGLFRRSPTQRAERAFSDLAANLSTGNVAQGIAGFATRLTGLGGLFTGVAIGAGVAIFERLATSIREASHATAALNLQIDKPHNITAALGVAGISSELQKTVQLTDQLIAKSTTFGARLASAFSQAGILGAIGAFATGGRMDIGGGNLGAGLSAQLKLRQDLANTETDIADIREKALVGSQKQATLDDISRQAAERKAVITNETLEAQNKITLLLEEDASQRAIGKAGLQPTEIKRLEQTRAELGKDDAQRIAAIDKIASLERIAAEHKYDVKSRQLEIEKSIAAQTLMGITPEERKVSELKQQLDLLQDQLKTSYLLSDEERKALQTAQAKTKVELQAAEKARGPVTRPSIGLMGETPQGIYDPTTGEFRNVLRPQEQANIRAGQAEAMAMLRADQMKYASDLRGWEARSADYLRGADYYTPEMLKKPQPPAGYDIDPSTGRAVPRVQEGDKTKMTKEEFQSAMDAVMGKYWGQ